jgi:proteasome lid subunit RPN8/RPN11
MLKDGYQYALMLYGAGEAPLGQVVVAVDWEPAREWAEFSAIRRGLLSADEAGRVCTVQPLWHTTLGEPYLQGFRISVRTNETIETATDFTKAYFRPLAKQAASLLMKKGILKKGERFKFLAAAFPRQEKAQETPKFSFTTEEVTPGLTIREASLAAFVGDSATHGNVDAVDMPLFVPQRILEEAKGLSKAAGAKETGGILIGHLLRDASAREVFAEVTAQIPARHAEAELTKLKFTPQTWTDVRAALELRRRDEIMLGWWHSHPVREWCKGCSKESQQACTMAVDFFSAHDHALHRTVFPRAYSIALVVNDLAGELATFSLFGWRRGLLESRGFNVTGEAVQQQKETQGSAGVVSLDAVLSEC